MLREYVRPSEVTSETEKNCTHLFINLDCIDTCKYRCENLLPFTTWRSLEFAAGEMTVYFCMAAFLTRVPQYSRREEGLRKTENGLKYFCKETD